ASVAEFEVVGPPCCTHGGSVVLAALLRIVAPHSASAYPCGGKSKGTSDACELQQGCAQRHSASCRHVWRSEALPGTADKARMDLFEGQRICRPRRRDAAHARHVRRHRRAVLGLGKGDDSLALAQFSEQLP